MPNKKQTLRDIIYSKISKIFKQHHTERPIYFDFDRIIPFEIHDYRNFSYNEKSKEWAGTSKITRTTIQYDRKSQEWTFSPNLSEL